MAQGSDISKEGAAAEVGSIIFSGKKFKGEIVISQDKAVVFICENKYYAPQLGNLRALRFFEMPSSSISKITYDSGSFPISTSTVQFCLKGASFAREMAKLKESAGALASMLHEDAKNSSFTVVLK